jgi:NAD(P)-dependent dehydrogenase (short-subunit alcohol dehydrogenase family)
MSATPPGHELAPSGIRVNAALPGPCATPLVADGGYSAF